MKILVIAPHPDDESIGCGGTIRLHTARGDRVVVIFLTSGEFSLQHLAKEQAWQIREAEARNACGILDVTDIHFLRCPDWGLSNHVETTAERLAPFIATETPDQIWLPHAQEWHPDHQAALPIVRAAQRTHRTSPLMGYEIWTPLSSYYCASDISTVMRTKLSAIRCYPSQLKSFRYDHAIRGLNRYRAVMTAKGRYAEVFSVLA